MALGGRLGEMPSSDYSLLKMPLPRPDAHHVHPDANELGRVYRPSVASMPRGRLR
jgi:acetolactate synthase-1/2/3 large subunit